MQGSNEMDWSLIRADHPGLRERCFLDTSSCGLVARSTAEAGRLEQERLMEEGSKRFILWQVEGVQELRGTVAGHVNGNASGTVLVQSFSVGMARLAPMLGHRKKVLLVEGDYPTLHAPFLHMGHEVITVKTEADGTLSMEAVSEIMARERPGIVAIGHVQWTTGFKADLAALSGLCRVHGAWSVVDATQSWCSVPIDVGALGIDILGASGYKWPLAGSGNGFLHLSKAVQKEIADQHGLDSNQVLSGGHLDPVALARLDDALSRVSQIGQDHITRRVHDLCEYAITQLDASGVIVLNGRDANARAGILMIEGGKEHMERLEADGVVVALRGAGIRIGIHFYNTEGDIDRLVASLTR